MAQGNRRRGAVGPPIALNVLTLHIPCGGDDMVTNNPMRQFQRIGRGERVSGRSFSRTTFALMLFVALSTSSCTPPDPKAVLKVSDVETYWVLDPSRTEMKYLRSEEHTS